MADDYEIDWSEHADHLSQTAHTDAQWYESVASTLVQPTDQLLADIGCGGAGMAAALAAVAPPQALVVAVDGDEEVLAAARRNLTALPHGSRVRFAQADLASDNGELAAALRGQADLIWASAALHHAGDQQAAVNTLAALLTPGGRLALAEGGLRPTHLAWDVGVGSPGLELRLAAAHDRWFTTMRKQLPTSTPMPYGWTTALRRAGLTDVTSGCMLIEKPPPLDTDDIHVVVDRLTHWVGRLRDHDLLDAHDLVAWDQLLDADDPAWLGNRDDVFILEVRSVHTGTQPLVHSPT